MCNPKTILPTALKKQVKICHVAHVSFCVVRHGAFGTVSHEHEAKITFPAKSSRVQVARQSLCRICCLYGEAPNTPRHTVSPQILLYSIKSRIFTSFSHLFAFLHLDVLVMLSYPKTQLFRHLQIHDIEFCCSWTLFPSWIVRRAFQLKLSDSEFEISGFPLQMEHQLVASFIPVPKVVFFHICFAFTLLSMDT